MIFVRRPYRHGHGDDSLCRFIDLVFRFRCRAPLELKLVALQHQLAVMRRQRPGRPQLSSLDRLLWVLLYRIWPQVIDAMVVASEY